MSYRKNCKNHIFDMTNFDNKEEHSLKGLTCGETKIDPAQNKTNLNKLMDDLGMKDSCKRELDNHVSNSLTTADISGKMSMGIPFAPSMKLNAKMSTQKQNLDTKFREEGCGSFVLDSKEILQSIQALNCTLNKSSIESSNSTSARSTVSATINHAMVIVLTESITQLTSKALDQAFDLKMAGMDATSAYAFANSQSAQLEELGELNIDSSTINVIAGVKLKLVQKIENDIDTQLSSNVKDIVKLAAQNGISQVSGANAMSSDAKTLINEKVDSYTDQINKDITETVNSLDVTVDANSNIEFYAARINIRNATINAETIIDMQVSNITTNAIKQGKMIANEILKDISSKTDQSQTNKGVDDIARELAKGNKSLSDSHNKGFVDSIKANNAGGILQMIAMVMIAGIVGKVLMSAKGVDAGGGGPGGIFGEGGVGTVDGSGAIGWVAGNWDARAVYIKGGGSDFESQEFKNLSRKRMVGKVVGISLRIALVASTVHAVLSILDLFPSPLDLLKGDFKGFLLKLNPLTLPRRLSNLKWTFIRLLAGGGLAGLYCVRVSGGSPLHMTPLMCFKNF